MSYITKSRRQRIEMKLRYQKREEYLEFLHKIISNNSRPTMGESNYAFFLSKKIKRINDHLGIHWSKGYDYSQINGQASKSQ